jgi:hypothetical protein
MSVAHFQIHRLTSSSTWRQRSGESARTVPVQAVLVRKSDDGAHVLEQSRRAGVEKLVMVGTICVYPKLRRFRSAKKTSGTGTREETNAPYGVAKRALLVGAQAYRDNTAST